MPEMLRHRRHDFGQVELPGVSQAKPARLQLRGGKFGKPFVQLDSQHRAGRSGRCPPRRPPVGPEESQVADEDVAVVVRLLGEGDRRLLPLLLPDLVHQVVEFARAERMPVTPFQELPPISLGQLGEFLRVRHPDDAIANLVEQFGACCPMVFTVST